MKMQIALLDLRRLSIAVGWASVESLERRLLLGTLSSFGVHIVDSYC